MIHAMLIRVANVIIIFTMPHTRKLKPFNSALQDDYNDISISSKETDGSHNKLKFNDYTGKQCGGDYTSECPSSLGSIGKGQDGMVCMTHLDCSYEYEKYICQWKRGQKEGRCKKKSCISDHDCKIFTDFPSMCNNGACMIKYCYNNNECPKGYGCHNTVCKQVLRNDCEFDCDCGKCNVVCFKKHCYCKDEAPLCQSSSQNKTNEEILLSQKGQAPEKTRIKLNKEDKNMHEQQVAPGEMVNQGIKEMESEKPPESQSGQEKAYVEAIRGQGKSKPFTPMWGEKTTLKAMLAEKTTLKPRIERENIKAHISQVNEKGENISDSQSEQGHEKGEKPAPGQEGTNGEEIKNMPEPQSDQGNKQGEKNTLGKEEASGGEIKQQSDQGSQTLKSRFARENIKAHISQGNEKGEHVSDSQSDQGHEKGEKLTPGQEGTNVEEIKNMPEPQSHQENNEGEKITPGQEGTPGDEIKNTTEPQFDQGNEQQELSGEKITYIPEADIDQENEGTTAGQEGVPGEEIKHSNEAPEQQSNQGNEEGEKTNADQEEKQEEKGGGEECSAVAARLEEGMDGSICRTHLECAFQYEHYICKFKAGNSEGQCKKQSCRSDQDCKPFTDFPSKCRRGYCVIKYCYNNNECPEGYGCHNTVCKQIIGKDCQFDCDCGNCNVVCHNSNCYCQDEFPSCKASSTYKTKRGESLSKEETSTAVEKEVTPTKLPKQLEETLLEGSENGEKSSSGQEKNEAKVTHVEDEKEETILKIPEEQERNEGNVTHIEDEKEVTPAVEKEVIPTEIPKQESSGEESEQKIKEGQQLQDESKGQEIPEGYPTEKNEESFDQVGRHDKITTAGYETNEGHEGQEKLEETLIEGSENGEKTTSAQEKNERNITHVEDEKEETIFEISSEQERNEGKVTHAANEKEVTTPKIPVRQEVTPAVDKEVIPTEIPGQQSSDEESEQKIHEGQQLQEEGKRHEIPKGYPTDKNVESFDVGSKQDKITPAGYEANEGKPDSTTQEILSQDNLKGREKLESTLIEGDENGEKTPSGQEIKEGNVTHVEDEKEITETIPEGEGDIENSTIPAGEESTEEKSHKHEMPTSSKGEESPKTQLQLEIPPFEERQLNMKPTGEESTEEEQRNLFEEEQHSIKSSGKSKTHAILARPLLPAPHNQGEESTEEEQRNSFEEKQHTEAGEESTEDEQHNSFEEKQLTEAGEESNEEEQHNSVEEKQLTGAGEESTEEEQHNSFEEKQLTEAGEESTEEEQHNSFEEKQLTEAGKNAPHAIMAQPLLPAPHNQGQMENLREEEEVEMEPGSMIGGENQSNTSKSGNQRKNTKENTKTPKLGEEINETEDDGEPGTMDIKNSSNVGNLSSQSQDIKEEETEKLEEDGLTGLEQGTKTEEKSYNEGNINQGEETEKSIKEEETEEKSHNDGNINQRDKSEKSKMMTKSVEDPYEVEPGKMMPNITSHEDCPTEERKAGKEGDKCQSHLECSYHRKYLCQWKLANRLGVCGKQACSSDTDCKFITDLPSKCTSGDCIIKDCNDTKECPEGYHCLKKMCKQIIPKYCKGGSQTDTQKVESKTQTEVNNTQKVEPKTDPENVEPKPGTEDAEISEEFKFEYPSSSEDSNELIIT